MGRAQGAKAAGLQGAVLSGLRGFTPRLKVRIEGSEALTVEKPSS